MSDYALNEIKIEVTYSCPLGCVHCSSNAGLGNLMKMPEETCRSILADAIQLGAKEVAFSGGEPLIWDSLPNMVKYAKEHKLYTTIYTSGNVQNPETVFKDLKRCGLDRAIFSLYSSKKVEHNRITRRKESFDLTLESIDVCLSIGIVPEVHFVALAKNYSELSKIVELSESHGVKRISVLRFVPQGRGKLFQNDGVLIQKQNTELRAEIKRLREAGHDIRSGSPFNVLWLNENPRCLAAQDRIIVAPDLRIYPCDAFKQIRAEEIVGSVEYSILDDYSLFDCWTKSKYLNCVRNEVSSQPEPPWFECDKYLQCKSGCAAQKYLKYGSMSRNPDPACLKVRT